METKNINKKKKSIENKIALNSRIIVQTNLFLSKLAHSISLILHYFTH